MSKDSHYLQTELYNLLRTDSSIFDFLQAGSLDGLWYWDLEKPEHEWMSRRFWEVLGYNPDNMPHDPASWQGIIDPDDLEMAVENFNRHCADPDHPYDQIVRYRHKDGHIVTIRCRGIAIRNEHGHAIRMLGAHNDISDLIKTRAAQERKEQAEAANLSKTVFVANISHEIRTPLNSLLLIAEALQATGLTPKQTDMLKDLFLAGDQLQSLLSDLIDISKIEAGEISMEREAFDPRALIDEIAGMFGKDANDKGLTLSTQVAYGVDTEVYGAVKRIRQVLINLVSNAIKFTPSGSVIIATDTTTHENTTRLSLRVIDTGPGVPDHVKKMIFDRFQRSESSEDTHIPGVGLGLNISKVLCKLHGGSLTVEDAPGPETGAIFTAEFDTTRTHSDMQNSPDTKDADEINTDLPKGLKLFVAEDVLLNRRALKYLLDGQDVELIFAMNGLDAVDIMTSLPFDVALIDLRMPGISGMDVVRQYRVFEEQQNIPRRRIIACSAHVPQGDMARYREAGFDGFLSKPFKLQELVNII